MKKLVYPLDPYQMNWVEGNTEWGTVRCPKGIDVKVSSENINDTVVESYTFTNVTDHDIFTTLKDISIYTPFNDDYVNSEVCVKNRCHTHIFCGENISYVMTLRMGGEAPHLGMVLTQGSLGAYSVERDLSRSSNDRGDFILHPFPMNLCSGESFTISWTLFWHNGKRDFYEKVGQYNPRFIAVEADAFSVFANEEIHLKIKPIFDVVDDQVKVTLNGENVPFKRCGNEILVCYKPSSLGEYQFEIEVAEVKTHCNTFVLPLLEELIQKRCEFIVRKQQYHNPNSKLDGAYLAYDNEEKHLWYIHDVLDHNGARERLGMGVLLARYLRNHHNPELENSLKQYVAYINREVIDPQTGRVYNGCNHDESQHRMYNYPFAANLYMELYHLYQDKQYLLCVYRIMKFYYEHNGTKFYAFQIPFYDLVTSLESEELFEESKLIVDYAKQHCAYIIENGLIYPPHEVNFEQSIVYPATDILLQMYRYTKDETYMVEAKKHFAALELFNGLQPDYHLYQVAIRHWDGFWFGKRKMFGDTFPHYWSSLTGNAYADFADLTDCEEYRQKAEASYRGSLSMFNPDGSASCACVYPLTVNGNDANFYDPLANDQDWALYYILRFRESV